MKLGDKAKEVAIKHVKQKAARDILNGIKEWRANKIETAKRRWIFELIQNAVDTAKARGKSSLKIEIEARDDFIKFKHNGGYFTLDEISAVIYGGSTKPYTPESEYIGRFGTGFLVTHILSRKVKIEGFVCDDSSQIYKFKIQVNRQDDDINKVSENIEECFRQLNSANCVNSFSELNTAYIYDIGDELGQSAVQKGLDELMRNIPFILAFNDIIEEIVINDETFRVENIQKIEDSISKCKIKNKIVYIKHNKEHNMQLAVLVDENKLSDLRNYPKIFISMPLTETADYVNIPFSINSVKFDSTKERDALSDSEVNRKLLECAFEEYKALIQKLLETEENLERIYNLVAIRLIPNEYTEQNPLWVDFNKLLISEFQKILTELPIVKTLDGQNKPLNDVIFPINTLNNEKLEDKIFRQFYTLLSKVKQDIPIEEELDDWIQVAQNLKEAQFSELIHLYGIEDLKNELIRFVKEKNFPNFGDLAVQFGLEDGKQFLYNFFELIDHLYQKKLVSVEFIDYLLPDQTGIISSLTWDGGQLYIDEDISEDLKNILQTIGWNIRLELVHDEFAEFQIVQNYVRNKLDECNVVEKTLKRYGVELGDAIKEWEDNLLGWIELFWWCVKNEKLLSNFPVITKDKKIRRIGDLEKEELLVPFRYLGIDKNVQSYIRDKLDEFEEIYPDSRVIHKKYFENFDDIEILKKYKCFITDFPLYTKTISINHIKLKSIILDDSEISKVLHKIEADENVISYLPFWEEVIGRISDQKKGKLLFEFVLFYILDRDRSWEKEVQVKCSCKKKEHRVIPSYWLASLKTDAWLPLVELVEDEEKIEKRTATKEGIEKLFTEKELEKFIQEKREKICNFLKHFGFDELDMEIKLKSMETGKPENEIREEVAKLVDIAEIISRKKELIEDKNKEIRENLKEKIKETINKFFEELSKESLKDNNRKIGENLEEVIRKIVEREGFKVKPIYRGGDLEIWPEEEGWDSGQIEIEPYLLEIKFTSSSRVHLSKVQSETARERKDKYIVLIVKNNDNLWSKLENINENLITEELVCNIIDNSHIIEDIYLKLGEMPNPDEIEPDIHGYWIKEKLWKDKKDLLKWLKKTFGI